MTTPTLVTGDDFALPVTLTVSDAAVVLSAATITAAIVTADHAGLLMVPVVQPETNAGSAWASGTVGVVFTAAQTAAIEATGPAYIELQVEQGGAKNTWFVPVGLVRGHIS